MHHALELQEILRVIFDHCRHFSRRWSWITTSTLASLARTCRTFKEPALDALWEDLWCLSPLARCLPEVSHRKGQNTYAFNRSLTQTEWDTLQSYTRRIRSIEGFYGLDWESVGTLLNPPASRLLFPNLRALYCDYREDATCLLHLPLPSLTFLDATFDNLHLFRSSLESFPKISRNIRQLRQLRLSMNGLDGMPALTQLSLTASTTLPSFDPPLLFPNLHELTLQSESLKPISWILSQIRIPAIRDFHAIVINCPSGLQLCSFWAAFQTADTGCITEKLRLTHPYRSSLVRSGARLLGLEDLQPCMAFSNLRSMYIDIGWNVGLTDNDLFTLASAWPRLVSLSINMIWGWNTPEGVTPNGLLRLLQICRSLTFAALVIDTRDYTEFLGSQESIEPTSPPRRTFSIHVLDSVIEAESMPAMADFFANIVPRADFYLSVGDGTRARAPNWEVYRSRWEDVHRRVCDIGDQRS